MSSDITRDTAPDTDVLNASVSQAHLSGVFSHVFALVREEMDRLLQRDPARKEALVRITGFPPDAVSSLVSDGPAVSIVAEQLEASGGNRMEVDRPQISRIVSQVVDHMVATMAGDSEVVTDTIVHGRQPGTANDLLRKRLRHVKTELRDNRHLWRNLLHDVKMREEHLNISRAERFESQSIRDPARARDLAENHQRHYKAYLCVRAIEGAHANNTMKQDMFLSSLIAQVEDEGIFVYDEPEAQMRERILHRDVDNEDGSRFLIVEATGQLRDRRHGALQEQRHALGQAHIWIPAPRKDVRLIFERPNEIREDRIDKQKERRRARRRGRGPFPPLLDNAHDVKIFQTPELEQDLANAPSRFCCVDDLCSVHPHFHTGGPGEARFQAFTYINNVINPTRPPEHRIRWAAAKIVTVQGIRYANGKYLMSPRPIVNTASFGAHLSENSRSKGRHAWDIKNILVPVRMPRGDDSYEDLHLVTQWGVVIHDLELLELQAQIARPAAAKPFARMMEEPWVPQK